MESIEVRRGDTLRGMGNMQISLMDYDFKIIVAFIGETFLAYSSRETNISLQIFKIDAHCVIHNSSPYVYDYTDCFNRSVDPRSHTISVG
jgi:hypothetical protein